MIEKSAFNFKANNFFHLEKFFSLLSKDTADFFISRLVRSQISVFICLKMGERFAFGGERKNLKRNCTLSTVGEKFMSINKIFFHPRLRARPGDMKGNKKRAR